MSLKTECNIKTDTTAVPFRLIKNAIDCMPYGCSTRVMFMLLALTGCRISEVSKMRLDLLYKHTSKKGWGVLYWKCGKNQTGFRKEELPDYFMQELAFYRQNNRVFPNRLLSPCPISFRLYFNKYRSLMLPDWRETVLLPNEGAVRIEHKYNPSGLRKTFATFQFYKDLQKWDNAEIAMEMTSKRMKHSCKEMTCHHYIKNFDSLELNKYANMQLWEILKQPRQTQMQEYELKKETPLQTFMEGA